MEISAKFVIKKYLEGILFDFESGKTMDQSGFCCILKKRLLADNLDILAYEASLNYLPNLTSLWPESCSYNAGEVVWYVAYPVWVDKTMTPLGEYHHHSKMGTMWHGSEYAKKRVELLKWVINELGKN